MITASQSQDDEFYIGYEDGMPPGIRRRVRTAVKAMGIVAILALVASLFASNRLARASFEFGVISETTGVLRHVPYPVLEQPDGRVWLAGSGKHGADAVVAGVPDGQVRIRGSRIHRGAHSMIELEGITPAPAQSPAATQRGVSAIGTVTLRGEIVDSKCFLGVMNPAEGAVHRDCARRCLSGGLPPMLLVRNGSGREVLVVLVAPDGRTISREAAQVAGTSLTVTGRLVRDGSDYLLYVDNWK